MSLPNKAAVLENRVPVSCIPSPESPENLITISSRSTTSVFLFIIEVLNVFDSVTVMKIEFLPAKINILQHFIFFFSYFTTGIAYKVLS